MWLPAFEESGLMRFDSTMKTFATCRIPPIGAGEYETPYALDVDRAPERSG